MPNDQKITPILGIVSQASYPETGILERLRKQNGQPIKKC